MFTTTLIALALAASPPDSPGSAATSTRSGSPSRIESDATTARRRDRARLRAINARRLAAIDRQITSLGSSPGGGDPGFSGTSAGTSDYDFALAQLVDNAYAQARVALIQGQAAADASASLT